MITEGFIFSSAKVWTESNRGYFQFSVFLDPFWYFWVLFLAFWNLTTLEAWMEVKSEHFVRTFAEENIMSPLRMRMTYSQKLTNSWCSLYIMVDIPIEPTTKSHKMWQNSDLVNSILCSCSAIKLCNIVEKEYNAFLNYWVTWNGLSQ